MEEKKKSNALKYILVFILGLVVGIGGLFCYNTFFVKSSDISDDSKGVEIDKDESSSNEELTSSKNHVSYSLKEDGHYYNTTFGNSSFIAYTLSGEDMKKCTVKINKDTIAKGAYGSYGVAINSNQTVLTATINFDSPVKMVEHGGRGQAASKEDAMLFLMQDGTVRYLNIVEALTSPEFTASYDKLPEPKIIENLDNVEFIYAGNYVSMDPNEIGGHVDTLAVKYDGTLVHIMDYVK